MQTIRQSVPESKPLDHFEVDITSSSCSNMTGPKQS
ncbi:Protein of unknown function [Leuconostoc citreum LBAE C11]|nr:Protein of unknown function [Leuconostoc citreum LBAE C11]